MTILLLELQITLFDPKDYQYDENFIEDDQEQLRILLRIDINYQYQIVQNIVNCLQVNQIERNILYFQMIKIIVNNRGSQGKQNKYSSLKEDILPFTDMSPSEIKQLEQEKQSYKKKKNQNIKYKFKNKMNYSQMIQLKSYNQEQQQQIQMKLFVL
ncbi:unnamed protein product [Paramecium pentaurelia]|uniref:Uncharacterized protein n=1 Tax=Paramecium pentaurelia TaxID=43138 RepID=A0A8S1U6N8_9CILI|nr:unnamed protein product [Paramecium pentaurelia]